MSRWLRRVGVLMAAGAVVSVAAPAVVLDSAVAAPASQAAGTYVGVTPTRVLDTRIGLGAPRAAVSGGHFVALRVLGAGPVPGSGVGAVVLNVTVTATTSYGYVTAYPDGIGVPNASNLDFVAGQTAADLVVTKVGVDGSVDVYVGGSGRAQLVADVSGYITAGAGTDPGAVTALPPARLLDTRVGNGAPAARVAGGSTVALQVEGRGGVPASGVAAVLLTVTVTTPATFGYVATYADGAAVPATSTLDFAAGQTVPNLALAPVGANGRVDLHLGGSGSAQLIADVSGYVLAGGAIDAGAIVPVAPSRIVDTRNGTGAPAGPMGQGALTVAVDGVAGLPATGVTSVVINLTITTPTGGGYAVAYADGTSTPFASNLDFVPGQTVANLVVAPVGADGKIAIWVTTQGSVQIVADVTGYVTAGNTAAQTGVVWGVPHSVDNVALRPPSCTSPTFCMALDLNGNALRYDGTSWSPPTLVSAPPNQPVRVSCASPTFCVAIANGGRATMFDGSQWTAPAVVMPPIAPGVSAGWSFYACAPPHFCMLGSGNRFVTNDGSGWTAPATIPGNPEITLFGASCTSDTFCMAVGSQGTAMTFDGTTWSQPSQIAVYSNCQMPGQCVLSVGCATPTFCAAITTNGQMVEYDGTTWTQQIGPPGTPTQILGLTCPEVGVCVARTAGTTTLVNGSWTPLVSPDPNEPMAGMSCPTSHWCAATAGTDVIVGTRT